MTQDQSMDVYFSGEKLWGDDFTLHEIEEWFEQEQEAYADLVKAPSNEALATESGANYGYHCLNDFHGFRRLPSARRFHRCLGLGAAYGTELRPIVDRIDQIDIVDSSERFHICKDLDGVPVTYHLPAPSGALPFEDKRFDLTTSLGCLHHIPNVSTVVSELHRVCNTGGFVLVREPITSMGDWRKPRPGGTRNERGIPLQIFNTVLIDAGFTIHRCGLCIFPPFGRLWNRLLGTSCYASRAGTTIDALLSTVMAWNNVYHRASLWRKCAPGSVFYVLRRDGK